MSDVRITTTEDALSGVSEVRSIQVFTFSGSVGGAVDSVNGQAGDVVLGASDVGAQPADTDLTAIAALTTTTFGRALLALVDAAALRTTAGLGTAATQPSTAFDAAGAAAAAQAASQPLDSDLTAIAALSTTTFGRSLLAQVDAAAARATLGTAATTHTHAESDVTGLTADLAAKAPLASPALTGNPTAPTQTAGNSSTRLATTAFVAAAVTAGGGGGGPVMLGAGGLHPNNTGMAYLADQYAASLTAAGKTPTSGALYAYGDSWTASDIDNTPGQRAVELFSTALGLTLTNGAVGGYRAEDIAVEAISLTAIPAATTGLALIANAGLNDVAATDSPTQRQATLNGLRAAVAVCSADLRIEQTAFTQNSGTWTLGTITHASGGSNSITQSEGAQSSYTITAAGRYYFLIIARNTDGGVWTFAKNGATVAVVDTNGQHVDTGAIANSGYGPMAVDIGVFAVSDVVTATYSNAGRAGASGYLDALLRIPASPRTVLAVKPVRVTASGWDKPQLMEYVRGCYDRLADEFGSHVVVCDPAVAWSPDGVVTGTRGADGTDGTDGVNGAAGAAGVGVPTGGTTGQVLAKNSGTNFDTHWIDAATGGGTTVKDRRWTLGAGETTIDEHNDDSLNAAWVRVDNTGHSGYVTWTEGADVLSVTHTTSTDTAAELHALVRPLSGVGGTIVAGDAFVTTIVHHPVSRPFVMGGLIVTDGTTYGSGKQVVCVSFTDSASSATSDWTSPHTGFSAAGTNTSNLGHTQGVLVYRRLVYLGSNVWRTDSSIDGVSWYTGNGTITQTSFTPTHVGYLCSNWGTATAGTTSYEFIRRVAGIS